MATLRELWNGIDQDKKFNLENTATGEWFNPRYIDRNGSAWGLNEKNITMDWSIDKYDRWHEEEVYENFEDQEEAE